MMMTFKSRKLHITATFSCCAILLHVCLSERPTTTTHRRQLRLKAGRHSSFDKPTGSGLQVFYKQCKQQGSTQDITKGALHRLNQMVNRLVNHLVNVCALQEALTVG